MIVLMRSMTTLMRFFQIHNEKEHLLDVVETLMLEFRDIAVLNQRGGAQDPEEVPRFSIPETLLCVAHTPDVFREILYAEHKKCSEWATRKSMHSPNLSGVHVVQPAPRDRDSQEIAELQYKLEQQNRWMQVFGALALLY